MELTINQLYEDYEQRGITRTIKSGKLQEVEYGATVREATEENRMDN